MKLAAIILLLLLLFNFAGYRLWFYFLQKSADTALVARLDAQQYNDEDLITIKVPLKLPYQTAPTDFERIDGEIKIEGTIYKYVKRKVEAGNLVLLCLPHAEKMQLQQARQTAFAHTTELPANSDMPSTRSIVVKNIFSDYECTAAGWQLASLALTLVHTTRANENLYFSFYDAPEHPPRLLPFHT